jgi:type I restriction enzyme S subunit
MTSTFPKARLVSFLRHRKEFFTLDDTGRYKRVRVQLHNKGIVLRDMVEGAGLRTKKQQAARVGQLLVAEIDAKVGGFGIVPPELDGAIVSSHYFLYDIDESKCLRGWLNAFIRAGGLEEQVKARGTTNYAAIRPEHILDFEIPLPAPPEQQRIVARIEELAAKIEEARALHRQAVTEAEALVPSKVSCVFEDGPAMGWAKGKLGDYVVDDCYGTSEKTSDDDTGVPILRMGNIQGGRLDLGDLKYLHLSEKDRVKLILQRGDILVNRTNSAELVGKCAVFDVDGEYSFASYLIRLRLDQKAACPRLVGTYINSPLGRAYMLSAKRQMTGQANVNSTKLKALPIALPPLPEQQRIVADLDILQGKVDELERLQAETAAELDALLPSILDKAFKGDL